VFFILSTQKYNNILKQLSFKAIFCRKNYANHAFDRNRFKFKASSSTHVQTTFFMVNISEQGNIGNKKGVIYRCRNRNKVVSLQKN